MRIEDPALLTGAGRFLDDIVLPEMLEAAFLRSPVAHGEIRKVDLTQARALPGVKAAYLYADLRPLLQFDRMPLALPVKGIRFDVDPFVLVDKEVCYVGEPIALIVAESRRIAEDAIDLIELDIEPLPSVVDPVCGLTLDSPKARLDCPDNLVACTGLAYGDVYVVWSRAAHVVAERFRLNKGGGHSIEPRGVLAQFSDLDGQLTVWDSTQMPHRARNILVECLGISEHQVRVITPDVGGGFGVKAVFHPEELAIPAAAMLLRRPVKWTEDRLESFTASVAERIQDWDMQAAFDEDGHLLAIKGRLCYDHGAATPYGIALPFNAATNMLGPYVMPACRLDIDLCLTNIVPSAPTRGAGRPQGTFVMERLLDRAARNIGLSRDEIRRRNLIRTEDMPYQIPVRQRDGSIMTYDSGDYPECQRRALAAAGWADFEGRRSAAAREGRLIGIGLANYVEATGRGPFESVSIRIGPSGKVIVTSGATAQGQGVRTMLAQIASDVLCVPMDAVHVIVGDTAASPMGLGAYASRQAVTAGNAAFQAAHLAADKAKAAPAALLEVSPNDLELRDGNVRLCGAPSVSKSLVDIARALNGSAGFALPGSLPPGLAASSDYQTSALTYTNGTHIAEVEVDAETGAVRVQRYIVVHDCGNMINPMMVEGQVIGGVVHGIGATLFEGMRYDDKGQPLSVTYADYLLPTSDVVPRVEIHHMVSPSPLNPLGVKGAAESGTIGAPATIVSAIEDALRDFDLTISNLPVTPAELRDLIRNAVRQRRAA